MVGCWGLVLLVSLFLPWYGVDAGVAERAGWTAYAPLGAATVTGWESLDVLDVILAMLALAAIAVPIVTAAYGTPAVPLAHESLVGLVALIATVLVLFRVIDLPGGADERELGLWAALVATLGIFGSALVAMRDQRMPGSPMPDIDQMPAPRPEGGP
jgi:hypothetical protein